MKKILVYLSYFLIVNNAFSQGLIDTNSAPNKFIKFYADAPNVDSAVFYLEKVFASKHPAQLVTLLIHHEVASAFPKNAPSASDTAAFNYYKKTYDLTLQVLARAFNDTDPAMRQAVMPLYLVVNIQAHLNDNVTEKRLVKQFIDSELTGKSIFNNVAGRYGLRICQLINHQPGMGPLKERIFTIVKTQLLAGQIGVTASSTRAELEQRAWYRWMYAYVNYVQANETSNKVAKEAFLKTAYNYSPDVYDKRYRFDYFDDMMFLMGYGKDGFGDDYFKFLLAKGVDKNSLVHMLLEMALSDPSYKLRLKYFYDSVNTKATRFDAYWLNAIYTKSKIAPLINLVSPDGTTVESKQFNGKWVLVDFWGTWCTVCRWEHPDLQKFYDSTILKNGGKISLLTIAAKDTKEKVDAYMKEKKFSFPVAMSDGKVENSYRVQGYPTKFLITPQGKYIEIPFGVDWQNFVKEYCDL